MLVLHGPHEHHVHISLNATHLSVIAMLTPRSIVVPLCGEVHRWMWKVGLGCADGVEHAMLEFQYVLKLSIRCDIIMEKRHMLTIAQ
jgi:hypothetical protein